LLSGKYHYIPLQTGPQLRSRRNELPPHQKGCEITNSKRLAGNHCTSSDNDFRLGRLDSSSDCPGANATVKRPSPPSPYEGREQAIKAKELEVQSQVALTVLSAEATPSAVGSLTYGGHHLSTDDSGHLRTNAAPANGGRPSAHKEVLTLVLATGGRTTPSGNTDTAPAVYDVLCPPPPRCGRRRRKGRGRGRPTHGTTVARAVDGQPPLTRQQVAVCLLRKAGERPSPPNAGGRSGSSTRAEGPTATRLALPPSTDDEHP
jgi:hypothetical protein